MTARKPSIWDQVPPALWPFLAHGVEWSSEAKDQWIGTALFSEKEDKLHANPHNGLWDEKQLGLSGNYISFLEEMQNYYDDALTSFRVKKLAAERGLPTAAFRGIGLGWSSDGKFYSLPIRSTSNRVHDLRRFSFPKANGKGGGRWMSTKGCQPHLGNAQEVHALKPGGTVYLCEGEFDFIAMRWLLKKLNVRNAVAAWVPGSGTFKKEFIPPLTGKHVVVCYDNDDPGDHGAEIVRKECQNRGVKLKYLNWPDHWPTGWDVNDFVKHALENDVLLTVAWKKLLSLVSDRQRRDDGSRGDPAVANEESFITDFLPLEECPTFEEVVEVYARYFEMDEEMIQALKLVFAVTYSQQIVTPEPLWFYLVAPAGGGKTALLSSLSKFRGVVFRSTVTAKGLVSGFPGEEDPSLLPKLNGKTFVIKDFTGTLAGAEMDFDNVMGILRDAFDGDFLQDYGNAVSRKYQNLHFSLIAGVTPAIHSKPMAVMGERFLKFCMKPLSPQARMSRLMSAMGQNDIGPEMVNDISRVTERFLARKLDMKELPKPSAPFLQKVAGLAILISGLRAQVQRDRYDKEDLSYRPEVELGTRPSKQLLKLAHTMVFMLRKEEYDHEVLGMLSRVAFDSCTGFNRELVVELMQSPRGMSASDLSRAMRVSDSTVRRRLDDLILLDILRKYKASMPAPGEPGYGARGGRPATLYTVSEALQGAWETAGLAAEPESPRKRAGKGRKNRRKG